MSTQPTGRPRLYTWSWKRALDYDGDDVVLVRISLGKPKWLAPRIASEFPYIPELAPAGGFNIKDAAEFRNFYWERLDRFGVERIEQKFAELLARSEGRPLVLLCYERKREDCHRYDFAVWWERQTGERVPEFDAQEPEPAQAEPAAPLFNE